MREQESVTLIPDLDEKVKDVIAAGGRPLEIAEQIAAAARADAPVLSGDYKAGIGAQKTPHGARVIASDKKSSLIEFGIPSHNQPPQFILRRAVDATGYKFKKGRG